MDEFRIRAFLQTAVMSDKYLPFDGILQYFFMKEKYGEEAITLPRETIVSEFVDLPIAKLGIGEAWYYAVTFAIFPEHKREFRQFFTKRISVKRIDFLENIRRKINIQGGIYKNIMFESYCISTLWVDWIVLGDKKEIQKILPHIQFIGKKTSQGWGSVLRWEIYDESFRLEEHGKLLRAIPDEEGEYIFAIRPPYWYEKNFFRCKIPEY